MNQFAMEMTFCTTYLDVDDENRLTLPAVIRYLQEIAIADSTRVGMGSNAAEDFGRVWFLNMWRIRMGRLSGWNENVTVRTWPYTFDKLYSIRNFEIFGADGGLIGSADSKWFLYDTIRRRPTRMSTDIETLYTLIDRGIDTLSHPMEKMEDFMPEGDPILYTVLRRDIDGNGHINNAKYLDIMMEAIPDGVYAEADFKNIDLSYKTGAMYGDRVSCHFAGDAECTNLSMKGADGNIVHALARLW